LIKRIANSASSSSAIVLTPVTEVPRQFRRRLSQSLDRRGECRAQDKWPPNWKQTTTSASSIPGGQSKQAQAALPIYQFAILALRACDGLVQIVGSAAAPAPQSLACVSQLNSHRIKVFAISKTVVLAFHDAPGLEVFRASEFSAAVSGPVASPLPPDRCHRRSQPPTIVHSPRPGRESVACQSQIADFRRLPNSDAVSRRLRFCGRWLALHLLRFVNHARGNSRTTSPEID